MNFIFLLICFIAFPISAPAFELPPVQNFHNGLSLQGFTGILNTPNAHVTRESDFYGIYTNQKENKWRDSFSYQDNYFFSLGLFSVVEIGGRLTWASDGGVSDISANAKLSTKHFTKNYPAVPVLAVGVQDISGGANHFESKYVVVSEDIWRLRLSAGYGTDSDRMEGIFAGGEFKAHEWLYLLADYDTKETNVGARVVLPHFWKIPVSFTATAKTAVDYKPGNFDIAVGLNFPLDFRLRKEGQATKVKMPEQVDKGQEVRGEEQKQENSLNNEMVPLSIKPDSYNPEPVTRNQNQLRSLRERLVKTGFMNVRVGELYGNIAVIEYENNIFNHNELDAIGVVLGMATEMLQKDFDSLRIIVKKKNIRMTKISVPIKAVAAFIENERNLETLRANMVISSETGDDTDITFIDGDSNSSLLATSLVLRPGLTTIYGSDYGPFDYSLSMKPEIFTNLWRGGVLNARWNIPLFNSYEMNHGRALGEYLAPGGLERLMIFQGIKLMPDLMVNFGGGMMTSTLNGVMNELLWQPGNGSNRIRLQHSWGKIGTTNKVHETFTASYQYYFSPLDITLTVNAGQFQSQDRGYVVVLDRYFGDTTVSLVYKNTTMDQFVKAGYPPRWQAVGIQFAFPLTPRKDMKHYYKMQVRGPDEWATGTENVIASSNKYGINFRSPAPLAMTPRLAGSLYDQYLNRGRLNESYIKAHIERLREAWMKYGNSF